MSNRGRLLKKGQQDTDEESPDTVDYIQDQGPSANVLPMFQVMLQAQQKQEELREKRRLEERKEDAEHYRKELKAMDKTRCKEREEDRIRFEALLEYSSKESERVQEQQYRRSKRRETVDRLPKYKDGEALDAYIERLEKPLSDAKIPREEWLTHLESMLTGEALENYTINLTERHRGDYETAKDELLELSGFSLNKCADKFFNPRKRYDMTISNSFRKSQYLVKRLTLSTR